MKRYRKLFYLIPAFAVMIFVGCSNKGRSSENVDYEYSDYVFDNDAPQYYMSNSSAASPSGYYFISDAAISTGSESILIWLIRVLCLFVLSLIVNIIRRIVMHMCLIKAE